MKDLFERGIDEVIEAKALEKLLRGSKKLRLKLGVDPTSPDLHLGHAVTMRKLRQLQDLGHKVILIIGDYTAKIGDPSGRNAMRPVLSDGEIKKNAKTYFDQAGKLLDVKKAEIRYNSEWLGKLKFDDLLKLAANFTVPQLIERDDFRTRLFENKELGLHELLYPVMQAYDSVELKADVEFGGSDQRFNILAGRALMKKMGMAPQQVLLTKLLIGTDGKQKMSKSLGNYIGVADEPTDMYGKVMSIPDELIGEYYELCTDVPTESIDAAIKTIANGANPRDVKASLAREIVRLYHSDEAADLAAEAFSQTFSQKLGPAEGMIDVRFINREHELVEALLLLKIVSSKSEARRLIAQGGVTVNDKRVNPDDKNTIRPGDLMQVGKKRFFKLDKK